MRVLLIALVLAVTGCAGGSALDPLSPGKEGALDPALISLYDAVRSGQTPAEAAPELLTFGDAVYIEATAIGDGTALAAALAEVGLVEPSRAGVLVNGRLPVASIPEAAGLDELRSMRPVYRPSRGPETASPTY